MVCGGACAHVAAEATRHSPDMLLHGRAETSRVRQSAGALQLPADMLPIFQGGGAIKTVDGARDLACIPFSGREGSDIPRRRVALHTLESQAIVRDTLSLPERRVLGLVVYGSRPGVRRHFACQGKRGAA
jgi:hypothetical protein